MSGYLNYSCIVAVESWKNHFIDTDLIWTCERGWRCIDSVIRVSISQRPQVEVGVITTGVYDDERLSVECGLTGTHTISRAAPILMMVRSRTELNLRWVIREGGQDQVHIYD